MELIVFDKAVFGQRHPDFFRKRHRGLITDGNKNTVDFMGVGFIGFVVEEEDFLDPLFSPDLDGRGLRGFPCGGGVTLR